MKKKPKLKTQAGGMKKQPELKTQADVDARIAEKKKAALKAKPHPKTEYPPLALKRNEVVGVDALGNTVIRTTDSKGNILNRIVFADDFPKAKKFK